MVDSAVALQEAEAHQADGSPPIYPTIYFAPGKKLINLATTQQTANVEMPIKGIANTVGNNGASHAYITFKIKICIR